AAVTALVPCSAGVLPTPTSTPCNPRLGCATATPTPAPTRTPCNPRVGCATPTPTATPTVPAPPCAPRFRPPPPPPPLPPPARRRRRGVGVRGADGVAPPRPPPCSSPTPDVLRDRSAARLGWVHDRLTRDRARPRPGPHRVPARLLLRPPDPCPSPARLGAAA